jgi:hypothetical protein
MQTGICLFGLIGLLLLPLTLLITCCTYEKEPSEWIQFSSAAPSPDGTKLAYLRSYRKYRKPTGLNRFPDGGRSKTLEKELALYLYDYSDGSIKKIVPVDGRSGNPPSVIFSWKNGSLVYWLHSSFNKNYVPPVSWSANKGIFYVDIESGEQRQLVAYGESPELSPDGSRVAFLKRTGEYSHELWMVNTDGTNPRVLKDLKEHRVNWIEWVEMDSLYLHSSVSEKKVYKFDLIDGDLAPTEWQYRSFPPQVSRGELKELLQAGDGKTRSMTHEAQDEKKE